MASGFRIRAQTLTETLPGRWLCLDALLDVALEQSGIAPEDRVLPLSTWDGDALHAPGETTPDDVRAAGVVYAGSAALFDAPIQLDRSFITTHNRVAFEPEMPFTDRRGSPAKKIDLARNETRTQINTRKSFAPLIVEWRGHGDVERVADLLGELPGIGAKTAHGFGEFEIDSYYGVKADDAPLCGVTDGRGRLLRPVPETLVVHAGVNRSGAALETVAPPYWDRSLGVRAAIPTCRYADGVMTLQDLIN